LSHPSGAAHRGGQILDRIGTSLGASADEADQHGTQGCSRLSLKEVGVLAFEDGELLLTYLIIEFTADREFL
jgi:hypothetical protein